MRNLKIANVLSSLFLAISFQAVLVSCASTKFNQAKFDAAFENDDYYTCIEMIKERDTKGTNIVYNFDVSMINHMTGDYESSRNGLLFTSDLIDDAFTKSISKTVAGAVFNPNLSDYAGNVYEYLFVNAFNSLNYYNLGNLEDAVVEIRKLAVKEREYVNKYGETVREALNTSEEEIKDTRDSLEQLGTSWEAVIGEAPEKPTENDVYTDSAFVRYLSMVFYKMAGDENAEVDGRVLGEINRNFKNAIEDEMNIPNGKGRLDALSLSGRIVSREEGFLNIPIPLTIFTPNLGLCVATFYIATGKLIPQCFGLHFTYPKVSTKESDLLIETVTVTDEETGDDLGTIDMKQLEDFDRAVKMDVATKAYKAFVSSIIRSSIKKVVTLGAAEATLISIKKNTDSPALVDLLTIAAMPGIQKGLEAIDNSEKPDTRQCSFFPRLSYAGGVNLAPGKYTVTFTYSNGKKDVKTGVEVKENKITLIESALFK